jgi:hypothetical protein
MTSNDKSSAGGDDALTLETGTGSVVTHGIAVDTFSRSVPTHIIPYFVRDTLFQAWPGMSGSRLDLASTRLPWYAYDATTGAVTDSVAGNLVVSVADAESWGGGDQLNSFAMYADLPFNPASVARWSFWRFDPLANELDPHMALEPQAYALDAFSQLFSESAAFHFGYLADIDKEYHRLRGLGPLGRLDELSSEYEAWYNLYHYWRDVMEATYLGTNGLVRLPQSLRDGNWTIADVLSELFEMLTDASGAMHSDLIITAKGYQRGMSGITLGVQDDAAYHDSDGNVRFYHPYMQVDPSSLSSVNSTYTSARAVVQMEDDQYAVEFPLIPRTLSATSGDVSTNGAGSADISIAGLWNYYASSSQSNAPLLGGADWKTHQNTVLASSAQWTAVDNVANNGTVLSDFLTIRDLPRNGTLDGHRYWSGHTLNFAQLVLFAREIGQSIEPQVLDTIIYPMGIVGDAGMFVRKPAGATARHLDEIYNLYEATTSFNENPARLYTGAHLGPTNHMLGYTNGQPDLSLRGMPITTMSGGEVVTAKERYWTPSLLSGTAATEIGAAFFPGAILDASLYRRLDLEHLAAYDEPTLRSLVSRMMGNVTSMRTKVEKPIYLPAGKSGPETVYASGVGMGAIQMAIELVNALAGAAPRYGLGHGGFTDVRMERASGTGAFTPVPRAQAAVDESNFTLITVGAGLEEDAHLVTQILPQGSVTVNEYAVAPDLPTLVNPLGQTVVSPTAMDFEDTLQSWGRGFTADMSEYSRGRGLYGGLRTPLHTIRGAISRIPNLLTTGVQVTQSATSNLVTWTAGAWDYVSGTNNLTVHHVLYQYPYYAVASRQVDGATVTFTVPMAHYDGAAYYNGTGGISINSQPFGWESKYDTNSSLGNVSAIRCLNTNGTWQDDVVTTIFEDDGSPLTCRWQVPNLSLPEHLVAAFDAANATFEGANGWVNDITAWDTITVRVVTEYGVASTQCGRIDWDGGSSTWVQDSTYLISGTDRAYAIAQQSDMVLSPRAATPNELNHLFTF